MPRVTKTKTKSTTPIQITLRVDPDALRRAVALAKRLSRPGLPVTRTEALRCAMAVGIGRLETECDDTDATKGDAHARP